MYCIVVINVSKIIYNVIKNIYQDEEKKLGWKFSIVNGKFKQLLHSQKYNSSSIYQNQNIFGELIPFSD